MSFLSSLADHLPSLPDVIPTGNQPKPQPTSTHASKTASNENILDSLPAPPDLDNSTRLLVALAVTSASTSSDFFPHYFPPKTEAWIQQTAQQWLTNVKQVIKMDKSGLPNTVSAEKVKENAAGHFEGMDEETKKTERENVIRTLIIASIFAPPAEGEKVKSVSAPKEVTGTAASGAATNQSEGETREVPTLSYTPIARALIYRTLSLLSIPTNYLLIIEKELSESLFSTLQKVSEAQNQDELAKAREKQAEGWGGKTGRWLATGAGVIAGGVAIGITGGLAAPAIAALIPGFMTFGLLTTATAPVVLGSIFGVTAGGLTGKRVRERWRGVSEFEFVEVGIGSKKVEEIAPTSPIIKDNDEDDEKSRSSIEGRSSFENEKNLLTGSPTSPSKERLQLDSPQPPNSLPAYFTQKSSPSNQVAIPEPPAPTPAAPETVGRASIESTRSLESKTSRLSLDDPAEREKRAEDEEELLQGKPPSLIATIIVPGLLITSPTEALTTYQNTIIPYSTFSDGRDVYVLKFETKHMLATGKAIHSWVVGKLKGYVKKQVIKRTALSAYFAAVALPMSVYNMTTMYTDNVWIQSQDKAVKAGKLLGEVLEKRVQGQRPVVLIGHSLGALTVFHALQYLASRPDASSLPQIVESAFLISLPSAPTDEEWKKARKVVARRVVNAWCEKDLVLALVVRLHEVVSRAVTLSNGAYVAGLREVKQPGVEDIDLSEVLDGHLDIQEKMGDILRVIKVDE